MAEPATQHRPTLRQQKLAEAVVLGKAKTVTEAARVAGLSRTHASESLRHNPTTQREIERLKMRRGDKARGILHAGLDQMAQRMPTAQDQGVAAFTKVAAEIVSSGVVEDHSTSADQERAMRVLRRYGRYCYYLGTRYRDTYESVPPVATEEN